MTTSEYQLLYVFLFLLALYLGVLVFGSSCIGCGGMGKLALVWMGFKRDVRQTFNGLGIGRTLLRFFPTIGTTVCRLQKFPSHLHNSYFLVAFSLFG